ncbi:MAG: hypothetical protein ACE5EL_05440, partial [Anaerolineae bacterium]
RSPSSMLVSVIGSRSFEGGKEGVAPWFGELADRSIAPRPDGGGDLVPITYRLGGAHLRAAVGGIEDPKPPFPREVLGDDNPQLAAWIVDLPRLVAHGCASSTSSGAAARRGQLEIVSGAAGSGEEWTPRKAMRRMLEHEREHLDQLKQLLGGYEAQL